MSSSKDSVDLGLVISAAGLEVFNHPHQDDKPLPMSCWNAAKPTVRSDKTFEHMRAVWIGIRKSQ